MKKLKMEFIHQGDVQAYQVNAIPAGAKRINKRPVAYGEHSGHQHVITGDYDMFEDGQELFVSVGNTGALLQHIHESVFKGSFETTEEFAKADHNLVKLEPGSVYKLGIHKKFSPFAKVWENVAD